MYVTKYMYIYRWTRAYTFPSIHLHHQSMCVYEYFRVEVFVFFSVGWLIVSMLKPHASVFYIALGMHTEIQQARFWPSTFCVFVPANERIFLSIHVSNIKHIYHTYIYIYISTNTHYQYPTKLLVQLCHISMNNIAVDGCDFSNGSFLCAFAALFRTFVRLPRTHMWRFRCVLFWGFQFFTIFQ